MKVIKWLDEYFEEALLVVLLILISCVELAQVIARNVPWIPALTWAEEFCRFCWVWTVFLSLPYTIKRAGMLRVDALLNALGERTRRIVDVAVDIITALAMGLLGGYSVGVVRNIAASAETSPAMQLPMWIVYSVVLIGFLGAALRAVRQAILHVRAADGEGGDA